LLCALGAGLFLTGCYSSSKIEDESIPGDSTRAYTRAVHVLVDGDDVGTVPRTVRLRRQLGNRKVSLWQAGEEFRIDELGCGGSVAGAQSIPSVWSCRAPDGARSDARTPAIRGEGAFSVPYSPYPIGVEDQVCGLALLVED